MDILTQGLIGATVAQSVSCDKQHSANNSLIRKVTLIGFLSGMLADADVLIRSNTDPLLVLEYHRHFTHSLIFIPIGALIAFLLLWPFFKNSLSNKQLYLFCFAGYLFSGLIDACTSYGTHLFWPFIDQRIAWHIISIIDPIFTGMLLICVLLGLGLKQTLFSYIAISFAFSYLSLGILQQQRAESVIHDLAKSRGHVIERSVVKPTLGNLILWRAIYEYDNRFYVDVVRAGITIKHNEGDSIDKFNLENDLPLLSNNTVLVNDIKRFTYFSDDYVSLYPDKPMVIGDVRYSMEPQKIKPLWGITIKPAQPDRHVMYEFYRESTNESRKQFMDMVLNRN